eukprot:m.41983 g.41983  ORF g.41983 m.41983 type:complete len:52 (+) comp14991_c0_seq1:668-823(+)
MLVLPICSTNGFSAYRKKECVCFQKSDIEATTLHVDAARQQTSTGESVNPH